MPRRTYIIYAAVAGAFILILLIILMNRGINRSLQPRTAALESMQETGNETDQEPVGRLSVPAQWSIFSRHRDPESGLEIPEGLRGPAAWDLEMGQILGHADVRKELKTSGTFQNAGHTPEEFKQKMDWLDVRINEYESMSRSDPEDQEVQQQLQNLYMLKSSLKSLENIVVRKDVK